MSDAHIFNINKPADWTSFDVVNKIRNLTRIKKVGHAGTLDPFATGVLLILTGANTKRQSEFMGMAKEYEARVQLGTTTTTGDPTGEIKANFEIPIFDESHLNAVFQKFLGETMQTPPMFSAKKVNGQKLYKLARKGREIEREPVKIHIESIELLGLSADSFDIRVKCGKGTYIRVLAEDLGFALGSGAHLKTLARTAIGEYRIDDSASIEEFIEKWKSYAV